MADKINVLDSKTFLKGATRIMIGLSVLAISYLGCNSLSLHYKRAPLLNRTQEVQDYISQGQLEEAKKALTLLETMQGAGQTDITLLTQQIVNTENQKKISLSCALH